jgi:hypothetical protein
MEEQQELNKVEFKLYKRRYFKEDEEEGLPEKTVFKWKFTIGQQYRSIKIKKTDKLKVTYNGIFEKQKLEFEKDHELVEHSFTDEVLEKVDVYIKKDYYNYKCKVNGVKYRRLNEDKSEEEFMEETKKRVRSRMDDFIQKMDHEKEKQIQENLKELGVEMWDEEGQRRRREKKEWERKQAEMKRKRKERKREREERKKKDGEWDHEEGDEYDFLDLVNETDSEEDEEEVSEEALGSKGDEVDNGENSMESDAAELDDSVKQTPEDDQKNVVDTTNTEKKLEKNKNENDIKKLEDEMKDEEEETEEEEDRSHLPNQQILMNMLSSYNKNEKLKLKFEDPKFQEMLKERNLTKMDHKLANYMLNQIQNENELSFDEIETELSKQDVEKKLITTIINNCKQIIEKLKKYKDITKLKDLKLKKPAQPIIDHAKVKTAIAMFTNRIEADKYEDVVTKLEEGVQKIKSKIWNPVDVDRVARIYRAVQIFFGFSLRNVQLVSLVSILLKDLSKPRILEVRTGEGKTLIIQCIALYKILDGVKVDIATSNIVLAKEGAEQTHSFFKNFGITVDYLKDDEEEESYGGGKNSYHADLLYGTTHLFSSDILSEHCSLSNVRNSRRHGYLVIDEVDSMMLDSINYRTIISNPGTRKDLFDQVKEQIWVNLLSLVYLHEDPTGQFPEIETKLVKHIQNFIETQKGISSNWEITKTQEYLKAWVSSAWDALFFLKKDVDYTVSFGPLNVS